MSVSSRRADEIRARRLGEECLNGSAPTRSEGEGRPKRVLDLSGIAVPCEPVETDGVMSLEAVEKRSPAQGCNLAKAAPAQGQQVEVGQEVARVGACAREAERVEIEEDDPVTFEQELVVTEGAVGEADSLGGQVLGSPGEVVEPDPRQPC